MAHSKKAAGVVAAPLLLLLCAAVLLRFVSGQQRAICVLTPTLDNADHNLTGVIHLTQESGNIEAPLQVEYTIDGLSNGQHRLRVNEFGSMHSTDGSATGELVRNLINVRSRVGYANGTFADTAGRLVGDDSIVGRSIVVLGNADDDNVQVAQCTIGRNNDESDVTDELVSNAAGVTIADCLLTPTVDGAGTEAGHAKFELMNDGGVSVSLYVAGLAEDGVHPFHIHDRGNIFYSLSSLSPPHGDHFVGNFTGDEAGGDRTEVGQIGGDDNSINAGVGADRGIASVSFVDAHVKFNGTNSIIGRSLVIHRPSDGARVAHCVIGIQQAEPPECERFSCISIRTDGSTMRVMRAMAVMTPASDSGVTGTVELTESPDGDTVDLRYFFTGLTLGEHHWHIHMNGDTDRDDGRSPGNHFVGVCDGCRTFPNPPEVGYIGDGMLIVATNGTKAYGTITDTEVKLNGDNSVVGRSIVVHGAEGDPAVRVAQGVIGRIMEAAQETADDPPRIVEGICRFEPSHSDDNFDVGGYVTLSLTNRMQLSYNISGLTAGEHAWSVNEWGHMIGAHDAMSTGGRFVGVDIDRQGDAADEVGAIGDGAPLVADADGRAVGSIVDRHLAFDEMNTIVGRSIVIGAVDGSAREAMCVIGIANGGNDLGIRASQVGGGVSQMKTPLGYFITLCIFVMAVVL